MNWILTALKPGNPVDSDVVQELLHDILITCAMGNVADNLRDVNDIRNWGKGDHVPSVLRRRRCPL